MDKKIKYNLTFWQWLELPAIWLMWISTTTKDRQSWHLVKKSLEKHKHNYTIPLRLKGGEFLFYKCDHEGCNMFTDPEWDPSFPEYQEREKRNKERVERYQEFINRSKKQL